MAKTNRNLLFLFLICFLIGSITFPSVNADESTTAAAPVEVVDEDTIDMDATPEPVVEEKVADKEEGEVEVEEEAVPVAAAVEEEETEQEEEEVTEEEEAAPVVEEEEEEETVEPTAEVSTESKSSFLSKFSKQDAKKIAAFGLGAWGAATGVGWAMHKIGGESD